MLIINQILNFLDLHQGEEDQKKVLENVSSNISFRGSNFWILACAVLIASVGLNVNSTAVIIGAMLISPLMGPIVGAGFSLGRYDFKMLNQSLKNLLIATFLGLVVSFLYFSLSPFKETQSELLARTSPNFYDVLIAFFGGLVGVIAITRVEKGNPIPGVAIATALMPPLCTAGYGLASGEIYFFLGAFYLYIINCVFICISTLLIVKYLKFPAVKSIDSKYEKKIRYGITYGIFLLILPSIYLAYNLWNEKKYYELINKFIENEFSKKGRVIIYKNILFNSNPKNLDLAFFNERFNKSDIKNFEERMNLYGIENTTLTIKQDSIDLKKIIQNELNESRNSVSKKQLLVSEIHKNSYDLTSLNNEIKILFPTIDFVSIADHEINSKKILVLIYSSKEKIPEEESKILENWLKQKFKKEEVATFKYQY